MANFLKTLDNFGASLLKKHLNVGTSETGKTLLILNVLSMIAAAASDTVAAAIDKDTSAEDKKFLVPAGVATGIAKIGIYFTMTTAIIDKLQGIQDKDDKIIVKGFAHSVLEEMQNTGEFEKKALDYVNKIISKAEKGFLGTGLFKKSKKHVDSMRSTLKINDETLTEAGEKLFKTNLRAGFGVLGAFIGAVVGSAILAPIIRDVSAWAIQKMREKKNPELKELPYTPYFGPLGTRMGYSTKNQPLSMKNYMTSTGGNLKI
ncbi:MAG: hypothetical protein IKU37_07140 [Candidatus Gastranaerophilales bacterium]|nr:hypothetical protein [Candidatus Gastranaerophilales bacterium]